MIPDIMIIPTGEIYLWLGRRIFLQPGNKLARFKGECRRIVTPFLRNRVTAQLRLCRSCSDGSCDKDSAEVRAVSS